MMKRRKEEREPKVKLRRACTHSAPSPPPLETSDLAEKKVSNASEVEEIIRRCAGLPRLSWSSLLSLESRAASKCFSFVASRISRTVSLWWGHRLGKGCNLFEKCCMLKAERRKFAEPSGTLRMSTPWVQGSPVLVKVHWTSVLT